VLKLSPIDQSSVGNEASLLESNVERYEQDAEAAHTRAERLEDVIERVAQDARMVESLRKNQQEAREELEEAQQLHDKLASETSSLMSQLHEHMEAVSSERETLLQLEAVGEDVSGAMGVLDDRQAWLEQCEEQMMRIGDRLDLALDVYDISDSSASGATNAEASSEHAETPRSKSAADTATTDGTQLSPDDRDYIDFSKTSNTNAELEIIREMEDSGEIEKIETYESFDPPEFSSNLPTDKTGEFLGERGNSGFVPKSEEARAEMARYGCESVRYENNAPDFSPFVSHPSPYGQLDCQVEIAHMTTSRANPSWEMGRRPNGTAYDMHYDIGNFNQADLALCDQIIAYNPEMVAGMEKGTQEYLQVQDRVCRDLASWRQSERLTWHECADGKTMQLVPESIHDACRHSGGVSTMNTVEAYGDIRYDPEG
jgi:hypothetical protein